MLGLRRTATLWAPMLPVLAVCLAILLFIAGRYDFPSGYDELGHVSAVRAQYEAPDMFADTRTYHMVRADDVTQWSRDANYVNHPALFYLGLAPFSDSVTMMRLANAGLVMLALAIMIAAGFRIFAETGERILFAVLLASFPKTLLIGGMVNNDNLALVAAALVFAGMAGSPRAPLLIAAGLALAGWTKLTALIALAVAVALFALMDRRRTLFGGENRLAVLGAGVGALPYLVSLLATGALFHVNSAVFASAPGTKPNWDFADYAREFFSAFVTKWPAAEASLPMWLGITTMLAPLALAIWGTLADSRVRQIGAAALAAAAVTLALQFGFGWRSFETIGDLTIAQTRYYNVIWPGIACAAAAAAMRLGRARLPMVALILIPTVPGGVVVDLLGG